VPEVKPYILFKQIDEIQNARKGTPLPFSEPWHEGMITIRGELYTVLNIGRKLGLYRNEQADQQKMILLSRYKAVLLVDELETTITVEDEEIRDNEDAKQRSMFPTIIEKSAEIIPILHVDAFIDSTRT
jgi:purine-binding chemotaxis protein CheW